MRRYSLVSHGKQHLRDGETKILAKASGRRLGPGDDEERTALETQKLRETRAARRIQRAWKRFLRRKRKNYESDDPGSPISPHREDTFVGPGKPEGMPRRKFFPPPAEATGGADEDMDVPTVTPTERGFISPVRMDSGKGERKLEAEKTEKRKAGPLGGKRPRKEVVELQVQVGESLEAMPKLDMHLGQDLYIDPAAYEDPEDAPIPQQ